MKYKKPNIFCYRIAQAASWLVSTFIFKRKLLRNEIKGKCGPFVVIANHGAALDFVNLISATHRPMSFVISNSFYSTLPIKGFLDKMGVIPKQQFQTTADNLKRIKAVVNHGEPVVIYPAGLMCEDGLSTPVPPATYKFLKWLGVDVYVARSRGSYFVMPKWAKGIRAGRTSMDIYRLFTKEELASSDLSAIQEITDNALLFDAYREQEELLAEYHNSTCIEGLQNVLYMCPHCGREFTVEAQGNTLRCTACGFAQASDKFAFLHKVSDIGTEIRYVSDWSRIIYEDLKEKIRNGICTQLSSPVKVHMIDSKKNKFTEVGQGSVTLSQNGFQLDGNLKGEDISFCFPIGGIPTLPFSPGKYFEVQHGKDIYRCFPENGRLAMKFINMVKIFFALSKEPIAAAKKASRERLYKFPIKR